MPQLNTVHVKHYQSPVPELYEVDVKHRESFLSELYIVYVKHWRSSVLDIRVDGIVNQLYLAFMHLMSSSVN